MQYKINTKKPNLLCLILLISFPSVAAVLISPALPLISRYFAISNAYAAQLITLFVFGYAFGQLLYSPFANRFGRKTTVYIGIVIYLFGCILALAGLYTHNFNLIILSRLFTALGSSVGMIISFTIINDFYHPEQSRPIISYTVLAYAFMPALAIYVGGFIASHMSWQDCLYFYVFYGFVILYISVLLPETLVEKMPHALKLRPLIKSYIDALSSFRLILFSLIYGCMAAFIYIIASDAPFIAVDQIGLSSSHYGTLILFPYCGQFFGSLFSAKLSRRLSAYMIAGVGYLFVIIGVLMMLLFFLGGYVNVITLFLPLVFIMTGIPMVYGFATVMAMAKIPDKATGAAVMSFITMFTCLIALLILTSLHNNTALIMPILFAITIAAAVVFLIVARFRYAQ